ncbi:hypothetical protein [Roseateles noduli]|uniref:hypothetical protein n=1 Tax=Roseateles noduli TaxID=2052484 RepID=UPI003D65D5A7
MSEQLRSATVMVDKILSNADTLADVKSDPEGTLRKVEEQVTRTFPGPIALPPDSKIVAWIWLVVVAALALSLLIAVIALCCGMYSAIEADKPYATKSDTVLAVITTIVGFLAGLLAPSPVNKK